MSPAHESRLLTAIRHICLRPGMYAGDFDSFNMSHLFVFIFGYEGALFETNQPSQISEFESWLKAQHPQWKELTSWWGTNILNECKGDKALALRTIINFIDRFVAEKNSTTSQ